MVVNYTDQQALSKLANEGIVIISRTIGSPVFTGAGLDDLSVGGIYTGDEDIEYEVEIDAAGAPDTFTWSKDGEVQATGVSITGSEQDLDNGVTVNFDATTGHTLADKWTFTAFSADPTSIQKNVILVSSFSLASGSFTTPAIDLRSVLSAALTIKCDYHALATLGMTVELLTSHDGVNYDTEPWASSGLDPTLDVGSTVQKTSNLDTIPLYMKIKVTNDDPVQGIANIFLWLTKLE